MDITSKRDQTFRLVDQSSALSGKPSCPPQLWVDTYHRVRTQRVAELLLERLTDGAKNRLAALEQIPASSIAIWQFLHDVTLEEAVIEIGRLTDLLTQESYNDLMRQLIKQKSLIEDTIDRAIAAKHFVIIDKPRQLYWQGEKVDLDWHQHDAPWAHLWKLARCTKAGSLVDNTYFGNKSDQDYLGKQKHRLYRLVGNQWLSLIDLIAPADRGLQHLALDYKLLRVFEDDGRGNLREFKG